MPLWKELINVCNQIESDIRANERSLEMQLNVHQELSKRIVHLLKRADIDDSQKIANLKAFFMIKE